MIFKGEDVRIEVDLRALGKGSLRILLEVIGDRFTKGGDPVFRVDDVAKSVDAEVFV